MSRNEHERFTLEAQGFVTDEYFDWVVYNTLSDAEQDQQRKQWLKSLAETEYQHYRFWKAIAGVDAHTVNRLAVKSLLFMRKLAGLVFTMKFLEMHEKNVIDQYRAWIPRLEPSAQAQLHAIIQDEEEHERFFVSQVEEPILRYIGFVALGLSDAIIEITGVHAGFLGVTGSTLMAGIAGLIVGFAASISMGVAAYLKAKSETRKSPFTSALVTSGTYLVAVVLLALPYFLTQSMVMAFVVSVVFAILLSIAFTFYVSVVNETNFKQEALENVGLLLGTALATYLFGDVLGALFGVSSPFR
jgi:VIT1/CCC1 family predicted Fe2+/Mn2+ transporter